MIFTSAAVIMLRDAGFKHVQSFSDEASVGDFDMSSVFMLLWTISGAVILPSLCFSHWETP